MAGTRTAPAVTGAPSYVSASFSWIDADDGETTATFRTKGGVTVAEIEAVAAAGQALSRGSLWQVTLGTVWEGAKVKSNAEADDYLSVKDNIRLSSKDVSNGAYIRAYQPSPIGDAIGSDAVVDVTNGLYTAWRDAIAATLPSGFTLLNVAFVQNVARNKGQSPSA